MAITRDGILDTAKDIVNGVRINDYGEVENNFRTIGNMWSLYLGRSIDAVDVANMMILLKVSRNASGHGKEDNWIDICGYAALGGELDG